MSKAIAGAVELGGAIGLGALAYFDPLILFTPGYAQTMAGLALAGVTMEAGAIAQALTANRGQGVTVRQPAANRQIIYGEQRVGGVQIFNATTGGEHDQYNFVVPLASHLCNAIVNLYLDGRQVFFDVGSGGNVTRNGVNFGGNADGTTRVGPDGTHYNFGSLVYAEARFGDQVSGDVITGLTANAPAWAPSAAGNPYVGGCCYLYIKVVFDATMFPQVPEIRVTLQGKADIYDPRTNTTGYTNNWALCFADALCDPEYGIGLNMLEINQAQLIAAANLCDEQVPLAAGGTESRYTCNGHFDTATMPGDIYQSMMPAAGARLSVIGGQYFIFPAAWPGVSYTFSENDLIATPDFAFKGVRDLFNTVRGTYVAPVYPYSVAGNLYDSNGFYEGTLQNNFSYAWEATDYPQFTEDSTHGYATNQWLVQDSGRQIVENLSFGYVISCATAQRVAKIYLRRNRFGRITTTLRMGLNAYQVQCNDVIQLNYAALGFVNKLFEVKDTRLFIGDQDSGSDEAPFSYVELDIQSTDPTAYDWIPATDELSPATDLPFASTQVNSGAPGAPSAVNATDSASTAVIGTDGVARPRMQVSWTAPANGNAAQIQVQYQQVGSGSWIDVGTVDAGNTTAFVGNVVQGQQYIVQIRALKSNGAYSAWTQTAPHTVSNTVSQITAAGLAPGVVPNFADGVTPGGSGTSWTLAHAPNPASSLMVWVASSGALISATASGAGFTTATSYAAGSLLASYRY